MKSEKKELSEKNDVKEPQKKPYTPPKLTTYGNVEKITKNLGIQGTDGLLGSRLL
jgi:hypothetical protein